jgi:nitroreductase
MNTQEIYNWRYATKAFDPAKKLSDVQVQQVLDALRLAPSSYGLQPWKFYLIETPEVREKVRAHAWNQTQVTDASHLIALAHRTEVTEHDVAEYVADMCATRGVSEESVGGFRDMMLGTVRSLTPEQTGQWAARQTYLALGFVLATCAMLNIDSCPMEGFDTEKVSEIVGATAEGYRVAALLPIGYRSETDETAGWQKVRYPQERVVKRV